MIRLFHILINMVYLPLINQDFVLATHARCVLRAIDESKYTGSVFLDLVKDFDTIDHTILCSMLRNYGFQGASYDLLYDYLSDKLQRVSVNGYLSDWGNVTIGVPQGSILGLSFLLHTLKSNAMFIGTHQRIAGKSSNFSVGGTVLNQVKSILHLGILIDPTFSWSLYIYICNIVSRVRF